MTTNSGESMITNVLDFLEKSADKFPDRIAFTDKDSQISFGELRERAKAIGTCLSETINQQIRQPVMVVAKRKISTIISFMSTLYSGNFYVPVDPKMPTERKHIIIKSINPAAIIATDSSEEFLIDANFTNPTIFSKDCLAHPINETLLRSIQEKILSQDPLFAIFTSGSTGIPKCVVIKHQSVINFVEIFTQLFNLSNNVILGNQAPLDYDGSVKEICLTLKNASTMHIIPKMFFSFPLRLFEFLDLKHVNTINWATSALRIIASHKALNSVKPSYINKIFFSGEVMPVKVLNYFRKHLPEALFVNLYGPTETTFNCSYHIVNQAYNEDEVLPIGSSFPNTEIIILDQDDLPVKNGEKGEICIRGTSLALGYYNNPEATNKAFVQNPLNKNFPDRIYRTGDLGKYNDLGKLVFISRMDHQIKHMGYRIELGEIETAVNALTFIDIGVCIYDDIKEKIVLFYQALEANDKKIITHLKDRLPKHMIPNCLIHYGKLPLKSNLKIDRVKLREKYFNEIDYGYSSFKQINK